MRAEPQFTVDSPPSFMERVMGATPRIVVGLAFIMIGWTKFGEHSSWIPIFHRLGSATWFRYLAGAMQVGGGVLALIPATALVGLGLIACTMVGAVIADVFLLHFGPVAIVPFILLVVSIGAAWQVWETRH